MCNCHAIDNHNRRECGCSCHGVAYRIAEIHAEAVTPGRYSLWVHGKRINLSETEAVDIVSALAAAIGERDITETLNILADSDAMGAIAEATR